MTDLLSSLGLILAAFLSALAMGYGASFMLLPPQYRRDIPMVAPATGFFGFCVVSITISGTFALPVTVSNLIAACLLLGLSASLALMHRRDPGAEPGGWRDLAILVGVMLVACFWSVLHQGPELYLGTVNPDFSQSLSFLDPLGRFNIPFFGERFDLPGMNVEPFITEFPGALQARFGAVAFAHLLVTVFQADHRAVLVATVTTGLLCLPPVVCFFSSTVLGMDRSASRLAGALVAISAPIAMSLVHALVGQNSAIASIPLGLALGFLALRDGNTRLWLFLALLLDAILYIYVMMAPFILAPLGAFAAYKLVADRGRSLPSLLKAGVIVVVVLVAVNLGMTRILIEFFADVAKLLRRIDQTHIYSDYLTEAVVIYAMGVASYPLQNSMVFRALGEYSLYVVGTIAFVALATYLSALRLWAREAPRDGLAFVACALVVFLTVGGYYTFLKPYGYSAFKMVSWLNFLVLPFMAYGATRSWRSLKHRDPVLGRAEGGMLLAVLVGYAILNALSGIDYALKSYGRDRQAGLVNSYGIANNPEWKEITPALARYTPEGSTVAMAFSDYIVNGWAAYYAYLAHRRISYSSHGLFPDDEAILPDLKTGWVRDEKGKTEYDRRPYFKGGQADFYLLAGKESLNVEIVEPAPADKAIWENGVARLLKAADAKDLLVVGRGFYRLEYAQPETLSWWFPERFRWSSEGGEILQFNPARPGEPYRLSFVAIVGYGLPQDTRTLEIFHNGKKIDEQVVYNSARIISAPFYPTPGMNKLTVRIKEKSEHLANKQFSLWNPGIPMEWRRLNMGFAQVRVTPPAPAFLGVGVEAGFKKILDRALVFNGFNIDGWLRERAEFTLARPEGATGVRLRLQIPGIPEYSFPYAIKFIIDGKTYEREFRAAGEQVAEFPLGAQATGELKVQIVPARFRRAATAEGGRDIIQSVHLDGVTLMSDSMQPKHPPR